MSREISHLDTIIPSPSNPLLFLRTIQPSDASAFSSILSSPSNKSDPHGKDIDIPTAELSISRMRESASKPTILDAQGNVISGPSRVNMMLVLKSEDGNGETVIGLGGFGAIKDWERDGQKIRAGDVGAMLDPAYKRKGYGVEAMKMAINWAFLPAVEGGPQLDLVTITTLEDNGPMVNLLNEKLGLTGKGISRPAEFDADKNEIYYELSKEDWRSISAN
ncbi:N-acetyltransferase domain-containing protein [Trichoderma simmonsii]|uniref:N-acetyltransferase domain-containing protein n=1 Tax=Trichoderma simmonsii TaxID=1491479 RepID=A0A8G0L0L6_9HYPO|nr:N-acetyltransferase domain-containing protein [Trichoderma simmonsii]